MPDLLPTLDELTLLARGVWPAVLAILLAMLLRGGWLRQVLAAASPALAVYGVRAMSNEWPDPTSIASADQRIVWSSVYWALLVAGIAAGGVARGESGPRRGLVAWMPVAAAAALVGCLAWILGPFLGREPTDPTRVTWAGIAASTGAAALLGFCAFLGIRWPSPSATPADPEFADHADGAISSVTASPVAPRTRWLDLRKAALPLGWHIGLSGLGFLLVMFHTASLGLLVAGLGVLTAATALFAWLLPASCGVPRVFGTTLVGVAALIAIGCRPLLDPAPPIESVGLCAAAGVAGLLVRIPALARRPSWLSFAAVMGCATALTVGGLLWADGQQPEPNPYEYDADYGR